MGLVETLRRLVRKCCRYSSLEEFEDAFDTALDLMQTKPTDVTMSIDVENLQVLRGPRKGGRKEREEGPRSNWIFFLLLTGSLSPGISHRHCS